MSLDSKLSSSHGPSDAGVGHVWQVIRSFFSAPPLPRTEVWSRVPVVALVVSGLDRGVLKIVAEQESFELHMVESIEQAGRLAELVIAPVILVDRDWPGVDWKEAVGNLSVASQSTCVVLISGVSDDYLRRELTRRGGYEVLTKPLRAENVARILKLARSYRSSTLQAATSIDRRT